MITSCLVGFLTANILVNKNEEIKNLKLTTKDELQFKQMLDTTIMKLGRNNK